MSVCKVMAVSPTPKPTRNNQLSKVLAVNPAAIALSFDLGISCATPIAVAYSGGADSTALLFAAAAQWPAQVHAIHIHHGLQAAADDFVRVCTSVCADLQVPLHVLYVDASAAVGESPEDAARRARYKALAAQAKQLGALGVLLGQHADDQVETLLLALSRGAGLPGLSAMGGQFEREGMRFYRPLLQTPAADLRAWLVQQGLAFVDDPTNSDQRYTRNMIRARLLPVLEQVFPQFRKTFARSAKHAAQAHVLMTEIAAQDLALIGSPPAIKSLQALTKNRQANVLRHWLLEAHQVTPSAAQLEQLLAQIAACTTRGHHIDIKVATGHVRRTGAVLAWA